MRPVRAQGRKERHTDWAAAAVCHRRSAHCKRWATAAVAYHSRSTHYTRTALDTLGGCYNCCTPAAKARNQQEGKPDRHSPDYKAVPQQLDQKTKARRTAWAE